MYQKMKNSALPPPLYKCIVVLVAAAALMLTACGGLNGDDGTGNVTITLPNVSAAPSANAKAVGRSISPDAIAGLRRDTVRYRVHMNDRVLEGTGGNFSANFPVGLKVDVYVECIGSGGNVIIRTDVKTIVVRSRQNSVDINLQTDGTVVGQPQPSAPQPVTGQVKYYVGNANAADGVTPPTDGTTYTAGDEVTVSAAPSWAYGMFSHWQADDATLKNETTGATNGQFSAGEKFKMPASGVVLTAVYDATKYTIKFSTSGGPASVTPATPDMEFTMEAANPNQTFASVSGAGYGFGGWEYNGKSYADIDAVRSDMRAGNNLFPANNEITLAAKWTAVPYTVTYNSNTKDGGTVPTDSAQYTIGQSVTVSFTDKPTRTGYKFVGWYVAIYDSVVASSATYTETGAKTFNITGDTTLSAVWEIDYNTNKSTWAVGDIVCDNGYALTLANYNAVKTDSALSPAVAVVYKNENNKVYIVGKVHARKEWCLQTASGYNTNIEALQCEPDNGSVSGGYTFDGAPPSGCRQNTDGSGNWKLLKDHLKAQNLTDDTDDESKYPAWHWTNNYGTIHGLSGELAANWYLPTVAELFDIWKVKNSVEISLAAADGDTFSIDIYWSSSQLANVATSSRFLGFDSNGNSATYSKNTSRKLCAVHQLTY